MPELLFVNYNQRSGASQSKGVKTAIRSQAARSAHPSKRNVVMQRRSKDHGQAHMAKFIFKIPPRGFTLTIKPNGEEDDEIVEQVESPVEPTPQPQRERKGRQRRQNLRWQNEKDQGKGDAQVQVKKSQSPIEEISRSIVRSKAYILNERPTAPEIQTQPLLKKHFAAFLSEFYLTQMAVEIPELDGGRPNSLRDFWWPFALKYPGLLHIIFLIAGSNYLNYSENMTPQHAERVRYELICLRQYGLEHLRDCLAAYMAQPPQLPASDAGGSSFSSPSNPSASNPHSQPDSSTPPATKSTTPNTSPTSSTSPSSASSTTPTDALMGAILKMAAYEAIFGSADAYHVHMRSLRRLVDAQGGALAIRSLDGLLGRMICWIDYNAACLLGTELHIAETISVLPKAVAFNPAHFVGGN